MFTESQGGRVLMMLNGAYRNNMLRHFGHFLLINLSTRPLVFKILTPQIVQSSAGNARVT